MPYPIGHVESRVSSELLQLADPVCSQAVCIGFGYDCAVKHYQPRAVGKGRGVAQFGGDELRRALLGGKHDGTRPSVPSRLLGFVDLDSC
jgi:hypothetical protein